jgi:hypothetical protein
MLPILPVTLSVRIWSVMEGRLVISDVELKFLLFPVNSKEGKRGEG